jgi:16S rRNA processing protein RimM
VTEYFPIGQFIGAHGLGGELLLRHHLGKKTSLKGLKALFVEGLPGEFLPWFIQTTRIKSETELCLKLEGIDTREAAVQLIRKKAWLRAAEFEKYRAKAAPSGLLGYHILDGAEDLGPIQEVIEQPHQVLCRILLREKEALIPLNESTLKRIDHKKKQVQVALPDGLLDIYR